MCNVFRNKVVSIFFNMENEMKSEKHYGYMVVDYI